MTNSWPALPLDGWRETYATLHMWSQVVGKIAMALTPRMNHFWNVALLVTSRGLSTHTLTYQGRAFSIVFDFVDHELIIHCSDGETESMPLTSQSVAAFYQEVMRRLRALGVNVRIWTMPVEVPNPIRFEDDIVHATYDRTSASRFWHALVSMTPVFEEFRSRFVGKSSPVHLFWGSFDLASTRFSGRPAPERPGADAITREAYSHEVISHGFWPGGGAVEDAAFYAYAAPGPPGLPAARVQPAAAAYNAALSEFILPYEEVRRASSPVKELMAFLESTYDSAADLAGWDRKMLERH